MVAIFPSPMNINLLKKMTRNYNIDVGNFHYYIVEHNSGKAEI